MWSNFIKLPNWQRALILIGIFSIFAASLTDTSNENSESPKPSPTLTATETATQVTVSPSATVSASATPTPESPVFFRTSALGNLDDMRRDVSDARAALNEGGLWKLYGNLVEIEFNLGQLEALTPQPEYEKKWYESLLKLQSAVDVFSEGLDGDSISSSKRHLDGILSAISSVERTAKTIGQ